MLLFFQCALSMIFRIKLIWTYYIYLKALVTFICLNHEIITTFVCVHFQMLLRGTGMVIDQRIHFSSLWYIQFYWHPFSNETSKNPCSMHQKLHDIQKKQLSISPCFFLRNTSRRLSSTRMDKWRDVFYSVMWQYVFPHVLCKERNRHITIVFANSHQCLVPFYDVSKA